MSDRARADDRGAAWCAGLPALLSIAVILHHPVLHVAHGAPADEVVAGLARIEGPNAAFHAGVMLMLIVQAIGLWSFAARLGHHRLVVRAGVSFYATATLLLLLAATIDGFATPLLGAACNGDRALCAGAMTASLAIESSWIQAFTKVALATQAIGLACWSAALISSAKGHMRFIGGVAMLVALVPIALLITSDAAIGPRRLALLIAAECAWTLGAAVWLWLGARHPAASAR